MFWSIEQCLAIIFIIHKDSLIILLAMTWLAKNCLKVSKNQERFLVSLFCQWEQCLPILYNSFTVAFLTHLPKYGAKKEKKVKRKQKLKCALLTTKYQETCSKKRLFNKCGCIISTSSFVQFLLELKIILLHAQFHQK